MALSVQKRWDGNAFFWEYHCYQYFFNGFASTEPSPLNVFHWISQIWSTVFLQSFYQYFCEYLAAWAAEWQLEVGPWRGPRLLVLSILFKLFKGPTMPPMSVWRRITSVCCMFSIVESLKEVCIYTAERVAIQCTHVLGENCVVWLHRRRVRRRLRSEGGGGFRIGGNNCQRQQVVAWEQSACLRTFLRGSNLASGS